MQTGALDAIAASMCARPGCSIGVCAGFQWSRDTTVARPAFNARRTARPMRCSSRRWRPPRLRTHRSATPRNWPRQAPSGGIAENWGGVAVARLALEQPSGQRFPV